MLCILFFVFFFLLLRFFEFLRPTRLNLKNWLLASVRINNFRIFLFSILILMAILLFSWQVCLNSYFYWGRVIIRMLTRCWRFFLVTYFESLFFNTISNVNNLLLLLVFTRVIWTRVTWPNNIIFIISRANFWGLLSFLEDLFIFKIKKIFLKITFIILRRWIITSFSLLFIARGLVFLFLWSI